LKNRASLPVEAFGKNKSIYELRFLGKSVNLFSKHVGMKSFVSKVLPKKNCRSLSTTDTHLVPSDLALAIWSLSMSVKGKTLSCCNFVARRQHDKHVLVYQFFQLLFSATSLVGNFPEMDWNFVKTSVIRALNRLNFTDSQLDDLLFIAR